MKGTGLRQIPGKNSAPKKQIEKMLETVRTYCNRRRHEKLREIPTSGDLLSIAVENCTLFQDQYGEVYGRVKAPKDEIGWSRITLKIRSRLFRTWRKYRILEALQESCIFRNARFRH